MEAHSADQSLTQPFQRCLRILDRGNDTLNPATASIRAMAERQPERAVCLEAGYAGNDPLKAHAVQIFRTKGLQRFGTVSVKHHADH